MFRPARGERTRVSHGDTVYCCYECSANPVLVLLHPLGRHRPVDSARDVTHM